jgi:hypothetical protein
LPFRQPGCAKSCAAVGVGEKEASKLKEALRS